MKKVLFALSLIVASTLVAQETPTRPRVIIPLVGRITGGSSGYWTAVRFDGTPGLVIRVILHPNGAVASASDPWMKFACNGARCLNDFKDIVAAIEASQPAPDIHDALGSLEIVPEEGSGGVLPDVLARIYFLKPGPSTGFNYGTVVPPVTNKTVAELAAGGPQVLLVPGTDTNVRRSVGFVTITPITYSASVINVATGAERPVVSGATLPADYTLFTALDALLGQHPDNNEDVRITIDSGTAIAYYTYTHNVTGEPTVVVPDVASAFRSRVR